MQQYALVHILDQKGLLGRNSDDVQLGEFAVGASHSLAGEPQPGSSSRVAVIHDEFTALVLDLGVVGGNALVVEFDVRVLGLANPHRVVVLEDRPVGWLVVRLVELKFYYPLVHVLYQSCSTFFTIFTLNSTSYDSCTSCSSIRVNGFLSLMYTNVPVLLPKSRMQYDSSLNTICACLPLMESSSGQLKSFQGFLPNLAPVRLNILNYLISSSSQMRSQIDYDLWEALSLLYIAYFLARLLVLVMLKGQGMLHILILWRGSRLRRLKGSFSAADIRVAIIESSSIEDTATAFDYLLEADSSLPPDQLQIDYPIESRVDPRSSVFPIYERARLSPLSDMAMDPRIETATLPRCDVPQSEFLTDTPTLPLYETPQSEFLRGCRAESLGRSTYLNSYGSLISPSSEIPYWELWKEDCPKLMSLNSRPNSSSWSTSVLLGILLRFMSQECWQQQRWMKRWESLLSSRSSQFEQQFLQLCPSPSLPMMQSRLKPSKFHLFALQLYSSMQAFLRILESWAEPSQIILILFSFQSSSLIRVIVSSAISTSIYSLLLDQSQFDGFFSSSPLSLSLDSVASRMALTTQNSLQRGIQLRSVMRQSRLALRYSISKSLLPSISQLRMMSLIAWSILMRLAKRMTCSTVQSILLCLMSLIYWQSLRMQGRSSSFLRMKLMGLQKMKYYRQTVRINSVIKQNPIIGSRTCCTACPSRC